MFRLVVALLVGLTPAIAQEAHSLRLTPDLVTLFQGTYTLDTAAGAGATEFTVVRDEKDLRLRIGEADTLMVPDRMTKETTDGVTSDVYIFTIANGRGGGVRFTVSGKQVSRVVYAEDYKSKIPGRRKPRSQF